MLPSLPVGCLFAKLFQLKRPGPVFDESLTPGVMVFEIIIGLGVLLSWFINRQWSNRFLLRLGTLAVAVFIFEMFTSPMWFNLHLGCWAYSYQDVSWILTAGWTCTILIVVTTVDHFFAQRRAFQRFGLYLLFLVPIVFCLEVAVVDLGIRRYSPEVRQAVSGISLLGVPVEIFYYTAVFMTLIISFYKYWSFQFDGVPVVPVRRVYWLRTLAVTTAGVLLFELMIEPMVVNAKFPAWSYMYHDITFLMTGVWVVVIGVAIRLVDRFLIHWDLTHRFLAYLVVIAVLATPLEGWFIAHGYRVYGPSAVANFSGFKVPWTAVPLEVAAAVPLYFGLIIGFVRYVEIVITNRK